MKISSGGQGVEPQLKASKASVLPLDDPPRKQLSVTN